MAMSFLLPTPQILQLEVTNDCNMRCGICMRSTSKRDVGYLKLEDYERLPVEEFKEVAFHGWGEPLLHPDLFRMVDMASRRGVKTSVITNATLLDRRMDELFESKLDSIAFGIYTLRNRNEVVENVRRFAIERERRGRRIEAWVDITILPWNVDEIPRIVSLAGEACLDGVVLHKLFSLHNPSIGVLSSADVKNACEAARDAAEEYGLKVYCPPPRTRPCRVALSTLFVSWDCRAYPCCFLCEMGVGHGNVLNDGYELIVRKHKGFLRGMGKSAVCRECPW